MIVRFVLLCMDLRNFVNLNVGLGCSGGSCLGRQRVGGIGSVGVARGVWIALWKWLCDLIATAVVASSSFTPLPGPRCEKQVSVGVVGLCRID